MERSELFIKEKILGVKTKAPRSFIIGTDWWSDCDDVVAMHILSWAHKEGLINILGVGINACMEYSAASLYAYLESRGLFGIPIGIDADATDFTGIAVYQKRMAPCSSGIKSNFQAEEPVKMYRRLLASSKDGAVEIIEIGFSQILASLLESGADEYSHLSGMELVAAKVKKLWIMAGKWDEQGGMEHNFNNNARASVAAEKLCRMFPCDIAFLGFEVGAGVISGGCLKGSDTFTAKAMLDHGSENGRSSWDPMLAVLALCGDEQAAGYDVVRGRAMVSAKDGSNYFNCDANGTHLYVKKKYDDGFYSSVIDNILLR